MTITAPTPVVGARRATATSPAARHTTPSAPELTLATWTHLGSAAALAAGMLVWPAALLVLVIPVSVLLTAGRDSSMVREHAMAALNFALTTLVGFGLVLGAVSVVGMSISLFAAKMLAIGLLAYLGAFLVRAGLAAKRGRSPEFPTALPILS